MSLGLSARAECCCSRSPKLRLAQPILHILAPMQHRHPHPSSINIRTRASFMNGGFVIQA